MSLFFYLVLYFVRKLYVKYGTFDQICSCSSSLIAVCSILLGMCQESKAKCSLTIECDCARVAGFDLAIVSTIFLGRMFQQFVTTAASRCICFSFKNA